MIVDPMHQTRPGWDPALAQKFKADYGFDPEGAKKLLAEAGKTGFSTTIIQQAIAGFSGGNPFGKQGRGGPGGLLLPEDRFRGLTPPPRSLERCPPGEHYRDWVRACLEGRPSLCPVEFACDMTEVALLGTAALRTKRHLAWDHAAGRVTNHESANEVIQPVYRDGWTL